VAISGSTIAAGCVLHAVGANSEQGAVYVFSEPAAGGWVNSTQTAELTASDGSAGDALGYSVAITGSTIVAGAPQHSVAANSQQGGVYLFAAAAAGGWRNATQAAELAASDGAAGDALGYSVAISGSTIVAGAPEHAIAGRGSPGDAYVFGPPPSAPVVTNATESRRRWREGSRVATITRRAGPKLAIGTAFSFALSERAQVSFEFRQRIAGRRVGRACVVADKKNRRRPTCQRIVTRGVLSFIGQAGPNEVLFQGAINRSRELELGRYTLIITATAAGLSSPPRSLSFTIV
jgi:hypothetical protein